MKLMCYLICFVMGLLMVGCDGDEVVIGDEVVTKDKPNRPPPPVTNLIKSEPPNGGVIWIIDDLGTPIEIKLFFDHPPPYVSVGGVRAQLHGDRAIWEVTTQQFLDVLEPNAIKGADLSVAWVNRDGSDGRTTLTFRIGLVGGQAEIVTGTVADGDQDVDPDFLNASGFRFDFNREVRGNITIQPKDGEPLNWIDQFGGVTMTLTPVEGDELQHGVVYVIHIEVIDDVRGKVEFTITFKTEDE